jgi:hypothetical protein
MPISHNTASHDKSVPVAEHNQSCSSHYTIHVPEHLAREGDPHYHLFDRARARLMRLGTAKCWICGTQENLEFHHDEIEFSLAGSVDWQKVSSDFPDAHLSTEEEFLCWIESEGNLRVLCRTHHTGAFRGVHSIPYPIWKTQRWSKEGYELLVDPSGLKQVEKSCAEESCPVIPVESGFK